MQPEHSSPEYVNGAEKIRQTPANYYDSRMELHKHIRFCSTTVLSDFEIIIAEARSVTFVIIIIIIIIIIKSISISGGSSGGSI